jgi:hypothetical protein
VKPAAPAVGPSATDEQPAVVGRVTEKPPVPLRYWAFWMLGLATALVIFYVVLTPVWMGIRLVAWLAEGRRFRVDAHGES